MTPLRTRREEERFEPKWLGLLVNLFCFSRAPDQ